MRKIVFKYIIFLSFLFIFKSKCLGVSDSFKFIIDTIGIPQYNVLGDEINEEIYNAYNLFVYSNPLAMYSRTATQRFKEVKDNGKWCENGGRYCGYGKRGEYNVLGVSYSGSIINNVYFPVDNVPEVTPDYWNFILVPGAYESWQDTSKYKYNEQLEYMKNTKLLFDKIDYKNNISDSYDLVEYNLSSNSIGLNKAKLNVSSTWKTGGIITVRRINNKGEIRVATMATKPMAANANVKSNLKVDNKLTLKRGEKIKIPITFGAEAINLNEYAKVEHIKKIVSTIYIDDVEVSKVEEGRAKDIKKSIIYNLENEKFNNSGTYNINIRVSSYLYTDFYVDGLMQDTIEKNITIQIEKEEIVPVEKIDVKVLEKENNDYIIRDFIKNKDTLNNSVGLIQNSKYIAINVKYDDRLEQKEEIKVYINDKEVKIEKIKENLNCIIYKIKLDGCKNTLLGWSESRNRSKNYFNIDFGKIGSRINEPNCIKIINISDSKEYENKIYFDVIDDYKLNINYILNNVLNKDSLNNKIRLDEWII